MDNEQKRKRNDQNEDTKNTQCSSECTGGGTKKQNNNVPVSEQQQQHKFIVEADGNDDSDWKRPLFYWKGDLNIKSAQSTVRTICLE